MQIKRHVGKMSNFQSRIPQDWTDLINLICNVSLIFTFLSLAVLLYYSIDHGIQSGEWYMDVIFFSIVGLLLTTIYIILCVVECCCMVNTFFSIWCTEHLNKRT
jgi:hypothetical protein